MDDLQYLTMNNEGVYGNGDGVSGTGRVFNCIQNNQDGILITIIVIE